MDVTLLNLLNPHTVVKKLHPNPGPQGLFRVKRFLHHCKGHHCAQQFFVVLINK